MGWYPFAITNRSGGIVRKCQKKTELNLVLVIPSTVLFFLKMRIRLGTGFKRTLLIYVIKKVFIIDLS